MKVAETRYVISLSRIKDLPDHRRPRELALEAGVQNVPDDVLVAIRPRKLSNNLGDDAE